jgi:uncharacterized protein YcfJ
MSLFSIETFYFLSMGIIGILIIMLIIHFRNKILLLEKQVSGLHSIASELINTAKQNHLANPYGFGNGLENVVVRKCDDDDDYESVGSPIILGSSTELGEIVETNDVVPNPDVPITNPPDYSLKPCIVVAGAARVSQKYIDSLRERNSEPVKQTLQEVVNDVEGHVDNHVINHVEETLQKVVNDVEGHVINHVEGHVVNDVEGHVVNDVEGHVVNDVEGHVVNDVINHVEETCKDVVNDVEEHVLEDVHHEVDDDTITVDGSLAFKKMNVGQLRNLAENTYGIAGASKMKKAELVSILISTVGSEYA